MSADATPAQVVTDDQSVNSTVIEVKKWRVWAALISAPVVLAIVLGTAAVLLAVITGVRGDDVMPALMKIVALPTALAFSVVFLITWHAARRDGFSPRAIGWRAPTGAELGVGLALTAVLFPLNHWVLFPALTSLHPTFDPVLRDVPLGAAIALMVVAVVVEETLYRGYALTALRARRGPVFAVVVTSVFYAMLAPGPEWGVKLWAIGLGLVLSTVRLYFPSLVVVVIPHLVVTLGPKILDHFANGQ